MPTRIRKGKGPRPWKIVERSGRVVGSSKTKKEAKIASAIRTREWRKKVSGK